MKTTIDGILLKNLFEYAYKNLNNNKNIVNDLNVFPVPDGDTGDNMLMTTKGGFDAIKDLNSNSISVIANSISNGMLMSARGNSGVILSQLFYGFSKGLANVDKANINDLKKAFNEAIKIAYKAVENPTEGTILTVSKDISNAIQNISESKTLEDIIKELKECANKSVLNTPNLLPVLKQAHVVDSGGAGLFYIFEGFYKYLLNEEIDSIIYDTNQTNSTSDIDTSNFNENTKLEYGYCSEILLQLMSYKCDVENFDIEQLRSFLNSIGDSLVLVKTGTVIKIHVHTFTPYKLLEYAQQFGEFIKIKIENMSIQHSEVLIQNRFETKVEEDKAPYKENTVVSVASGDGIVNLFKELGCDYVVDGGQTSNPSTEDFIKAFDSLNTKNIFVLPNNSNIILAAKQAASIYTKANVVVIETKNIGDGYSILSMMDLSVSDPKAIEEDMKFNMEGTKTSLITKAVRDTELDGINIRKDDYIGFIGKKMLSSNANRIDTLKEIVDKTDNHNEIAMLIYGLNSKEEERVEFQKHLKENHKNLEYFEIDGKQDIYDYYLLIQ